MKWQWVSRKRHLQELADLKDSNCRDYERYQNRLLEEAGKHVIPKLVEVTFSHMRDIYSVHVALDARMMHSLNEGTEREYVSRMVGRYVVNEIMSSKFVRPYR